MVDKARNDLEGASSRVDCGDLHRVGDHFGLDLLAVVQMIVIDVVVDERDDNYVS